MALVQGVWMLVVVVFLLRYLGQGLMGHTSVTSQGRYYDAARGRALATVALGGPLARATLPLAVVVTVAAIGWRQSWIVFAAALGLVLLPVCLWLLRGHDRRHDRYLNGVGDEAPHEGGPAGSAPAHWTRKAVLRDPRFYALLPIVLAPSFIGTGLIFHQVVLIEAKGWTLETWAAAFIGHAAASVISGLALSAAIDRVGAARAAVAIAAAGLRLSLAERIGRRAGGVGLHDSRRRHVGDTMVFFDAFWPQAYGTRHLGSIRGLAFAFMVLTGALAPALMGAALDGGVAIEAITLACTVYCAFASLIAVPATRLFRRK